MPVHHVPDPVLGVELLLVGVRSRVGQGGGRGQFPRFQAQSLRHNRVHEALTLLVVASLLLEEGLHLDLWV